MLNSWEAGRAHGRLFSLKSQEPRLVSGSSPIPPEPQMDLCDPGNEREEDKRHRGTSQLSFGEGGGTYHVTRLFLSH